MLDLSRIAEAVRYEGGVSRRLFLGYAASLASIPLLGRQAAAGRRAVSFKADPFSVGVASGDPTERGVVLWTRLAPEPLVPGGGLAPENIEVAWEIANDESMRQVVERGTVVATPELAHSVHVEVENLEPNRWYWYRFRAGDAQSAVGRTRTMPLPDATPRELRFAFASCQHYESGFYTAYEHMAQEDLDLVFHLGDYIYEYAGKSDQIRKHAGNECESLDDYRSRHAQYKSDPLLQRMHARCPWMVTWDDHEFDNDYANDVSEERGVDPADFLVRRANAYRAYYEMMPLRHSSLPRGPHMQLYRKLSVGRLIEFLVLDTRQYRTNQPNGGGRSGINDAALSPEGTILGPQQKAWMQNALLESSARWNALAQQVMMGMVSFGNGGRESYSMDKWTGYLHDRRQLIEFLAERKIRNPIMLAGDIHSNWANNLRMDDREGELPVVATEFVGTSITSGGNGVEKPDYLDRIIARNPCVQYHNAERGYVSCTVTPKTWRTDFRCVSDVTRPGAKVTTRASYVVESGQPGARPA